MQPRRNHHRNSATAHLFVGGQFARFAFQHHRDAVANRKSQAIGLADQFLGGLVKHQRAFADRADEISSSLLSMAQFFQRRNQPAHQPASSWAVTGKTRVYHYRALAILTASLLVITTASASAGKSAAVKA